MRKHTEKDRWKSRENVGPLESVKERDEGCRIKIGLKVIKESIVIRTK